jgi:hypothetical protein
MIMTPEQCFLCPDITCTDHNQGRYVLDELTGKVPFTKEKIEDCPIREAFISIEGRWDLIDLGGQNEQR